MAKEFRLAPSTNFTLYEQVDDRTARAIFIHMGDNPKVFECIIKTKAAKLANTPHKFNHETYTNGFILGLIIAGSCKDGKLPPISYYPCAKASKKSPSRAAA